MKKMELLAPAGDLEKLKIAVVIEHAKAKERVKFDAVVRQTSKIGRASCRERV